MIGLPRSPRDTASSHRLNKVLHLGDSVALVRASFRECPYDPQGRSWKELRHRVRVASFSRRAFVLARRSLLGRLVCCLLGKSLP